MREFPRRFVEFNLTLAGQDKQIFENLLATQQAEPLFLPLWHEKSALSAQANDGALTLFLDTTLRSFLVGGYAIVFTDKFTYEIASITGKTDSSLTLSVALVGTWSAQTAVYPLCLARLEESVKPSRKSSQVLQVALKFWLEETAAAFSGVALAETYRGDIAVLNTRNNWERQVNSEYNRQLETLDFNIYGRFVDDQSGLATVFLDYHFLLKSLAERHAFITFLYSLAGKWTAVWVPTGQHDFTLINPVTSGDTTITVQYSGVSLYGISGVKQDVKISLNNGAAYYRRVTAAANNSNGTETLTLDSAINADIAVSEVLIISYLLLMRSASDMLTLEHQSNAVAQCSLLFQTVYAPPAAPLPSAPSLLAIPQAYVDNITLIDGVLYYLANQGSLYTCDLQIQAITWVYSHTNYRTKIVSDGISLYLTQQTMFFYRLNRTSIPYTHDYEVIAGGSVCSCTNQTYAFTLTGDVIKKINKVTGELLAALNTKTPLFGDIMIADEVYLYYCMGPYWLDTSQPSQLQRVNIVDFTETTMLMLPLTFPTQIASTMALTSRHVWITAKPDKLLRVSLADNSLTVFTVSGYTTNTSGSFETMGNQVHITYIQQLDLLVLSCGVEGVVKYINQDATDESNLVNQIIETAIQPMQITYDANNNCIYVTSWGGAFITKIS